MEWPTEGGLYWIEATKDGTDVKGVVFAFEFPNGLVLEALKVSPEILAQWADDVTLLGCEPLRVVPARLVEVLTSDASTVAKFDAMDELAEWMATHEQVVL